MKVLKRPVIAKSRCRKAREVNFLEDKFRANSSLELCNNKNDRTNGSCEV